MEILNELGIQEKNQGASTGTGWNTTRDSGELAVISPVDGRLLATVYLASEQDYRDCVASAKAAFHTWRTVPPPKRGEIVRRIGDALRARKTPLGTLVSWEMGKIPAGGPGRGPGNDRYLRFRRRPVAPALRPHHGLGTARASPL